MSLPIDFKTCILNEFDQLETTWNNWGQGKVFWRTGNTLDACVDFIVAAQTAWGADDPDIKLRQGALQTMLQDGYQLFLKVYANDKANNFDPLIKDVSWWDDYGWWGITFLKIYANFDALFGSASSDASTDCYQADALTKDRCLQHAIDCWSILVKYAWLDANQRSGIPAHPVAGGCWNNYFDNSSGGVQNTVTNAAFLVLSIRLYFATKENSARQQESQGFLNTACAQYRWFGEWFINRGIFAYRSPMPDQIYYWVLERPVVATSSYNKEGQPPYAQDQKWSGDQGLILGGLAGLLAAKEDITGNPDIIALGNELQKAGLSYTALGLATSLLSWIGSGCTWLFTWNTCRVLHEAPLSSAFIINYPTDYATGKGVLMRYLAYVRHLPVSLGYLDTYYDDLVIGTASALCTYPPTQSNGYGLIWDNDSKKDSTSLGTNEADFIQYHSAVDDNPWHFSIQTTRLDALTTAIPLRDKVSSC